MTDSVTIRDELNQLRKDVPPGSVWKHKKGGVYMVTGASWHTEDDAALVSYFRLSGPGFNQDEELGIVYSRPADMWKPDRFTKVSNFNVD
jgi:hypothetical protein